MPEQPPILDNRALQDILQQLRALAGIRVPEWKPPAEGDAGIMLQRIFARLFELTLERLNKAPEKNLLAFLDTMGVELLPPSPAQVPLTFALTAGTPATRVPKGTQAGTLSSGQETAVSFETEDGLTVIPARLTMDFTMDPQWDRFTDQTVVIAGQSAIGFTPFVGVQRMPHVLYLGDEFLLDFAKATVELSVLGQPANLSLEALRAFLKQLSWQYTGDGQLKTLTPTDPEVGPPFIIRFVGVETIDRSVVRGPSTSAAIQKGISSHWLQAVLTTPFRDDLVAQVLRLSELRLKVSAGDLAPDLAFSNTALVDVTRNFRPFGETPEAGDTFFIASREAFSKPNAKVTLHVEVKTSPAPTLIWEFSSDNLEWKPLPSTSLEDGTNGFTTSGTISLLRPDMSLGGVNGVLAFWFRVRLEKSRYTGAPKVKKFRFRFIRETTLAEEASPNQDTITLSTPDFVEADQILEVEDEFVKVIKVENAQTFQVTPALRRAHGKEASVQHRKLFSSDEQARKLSDKAKKGENLLTVNSNVNSGQFSRNFMIDDKGKIEFIAVKFVSNDGKDLKLLTEEPLQFDHNENTVLRPVSDFIGFANDKRVDFTAPFHPFGRQPGTGDLFYFGATEGFPFDFNIDVELEMDSPDVKLQWEFFGATGWRSFLPFLPDQDQDPAPIDDTTNDFAQNGVIVLPARTHLATEVNGQHNYWIRARLNDGNYGVPIAFVPLDPENLAKGFRIQSGSDSLNPPVITNLTLSYEAEAAPTVITQNGFFYGDQTAANTTADGFPPFVAVKDLKPDLYADTEPSFYLGFDAAFPEQPVTLYVAAAPRAFAGSVSKEPRSAFAPSSATPSLQWEYFNGTTWRRLTVIDGTINLTESGTVEFLTPPDMAALAKFDLTPRYWLRARAPANDPFETPHVLGVFPNTIAAIQAVTVANEILGSSNAQPQQTFRFTRTPVLPQQQVLVREPESPSETERAAIFAEEGNDAVQERTNPVTGEREIWVRWHQVPNFLPSDLRSRHCTLDRMTGILTFGDGKAGQIPPRGTNNIVAAYRTGGGPDGNVAKAAAAQVQSPLPGVAAVTNPVAADGGAEAETIPLVQARGPQTLRHRDRVVACADLEWLARQAAGTRVARTKCLSNVNGGLHFEPGWVTLIIVPQGNGAKLSPNSGLIRTVRDYLAARAFVGLAQPEAAKINVIGPGYIQVVVVSEIVPQDIDDAEPVKQQVHAALMAFFHSLSGGPSGAGWEFGRDVYESEVYHILEGVPGVSHVPSLQLIPNLAQHRLTFTSSPMAVFDLPEGSAVITTNRQKAALLAESLAPGATVERLAIKGFKEGDRITKVQDLIVNTTPAPGAREIFVQPFNSDAVGFPAGSLVMTFNGAHGARLAKGIPRDQTGLDRILIELSEDGDFAAQLKSGDVLTVFYPFPMTITSVRLESATITGVSTEAQTLGIETYETEVAFPPGSVLATLDNRVRMPLATTAPARQVITAVQVIDFASNDTLIVARRDRAFATPPLMIAEVSPVTDIVYLDDNFLVYSGAHQITMVAK